MTHFEKAERLLTAAQKRIDDLDAEKLPSHSAKRHALESRANTYVAMAQVYATLATALQINDVSNSVAAGPLD
jgi:hypothetical protein